LLMAHHHPQGSLLLILPPLLLLLACCHQYSSSFLPCRLESNKQTFEVWQLRRAARSKQPKTPSDETKTIGLGIHPEAEVLQQQPLRRPHPTQHQNHYGPDHQKTYSFDSPKFSQPIFPPPEPSSKPRH
jgi:hypothetical protein